MDLSTTFTGMKFLNPFLLSSAPPTESEQNILRAFEAGWGGVVTKTIGLHPVVNVLGPKTKFLRADADSARLSMKKRPNAALAACADITDITLTLPNRHHLLVDLQPFGLDNPNEVFVATDQPYGLIEATITRTND